MLTSGLPPWLVVPALQSCQSPIWISLVNYLHYIYLFLQRSRVRFRMPPGFRTELHVTTLLSTGGGPVSYVQLSPGGFQVDYPLGLWS